MKKKLILVFILISLICSDLFSIDLDIVSNTEIKEITYDILLPDGTKHSFIRQIRIPLKNQHIDSKFTLQIISKSKATRKIILQSPNNLEVRIYKYNRSNGTLEHTYTKLINKNCEEFEYTKPNNEDTTILIFITNFGDIISEKIYW